jgi:hypothetical protein
MSTGALSFVVLFSGVGRVHRRMASYSDSLYWDSPAENRLRKRKVRHVNSGFVPRVAQAEFIHDSFIKSKKQSYFFAKIFKFLLGGRSEVDPMLHHDGWKASEDYDKEASFGWSGFSFWKHANEEVVHDRQCVPMMEWQTTSYPNCNVGE